MSLCSSAADVVVVAIAHCVMTLRMHASRAWVLLSVAFCSIAMLSSHKCYMVAAMPKIEMSEEQP